MPDPRSFDRPFPALTPAQRYSLDLNGYVVVQNTLSPPEIRGLLDAMRHTRDEILKLPDTTRHGPQYNGSYLAINQPHHYYLGCIIEAHPLITSYATHPRLVAMAEELIGGEARIVEMNAHLNSRVPGWHDDPKPQYGFHRGTDIPFGSHTVNGLYNCGFVKTLTNLTDLGPNDGGTVVIAGSHKIDVPTDDIVACAYEDRSLIHQVVAPAGSTLLFSETLIHATGQIRSEKERAVIITGYGSRLFPYWDDHELSPEFKQQIPESLNTLFYGVANWERGPRYRRLSDPVDPRPFALGHWNDRPPPTAAK